MIKLELVSGVAVRPYSKVLAGEIPVMTASLSLASFMPERNMALKALDLAPSMALWTLKLLEPHFRVKSAVSGSSSRLGWSCLLCRG